ncbi:MAG: hypothetical protein RLZZ245_2299, partial [Verrucomicrobiota bacterium]
ESFEAGVVEHAGCLKNPHQWHWAGGGDGFVFGTGLGDRPLHVRLAASEPHLADEQVGDFDRRQARLSHAQGAAIRAGLHGWELGEPASVRVCRGGLSLAGEGNRHLLAGAGFAPDGDGFFPLQDSARLKEGGHRDFRTGWLTEQQKRDPMISGFQHAAFYVGKTPDVTPNFRILGPYGGLDNPRKCRKNSCVFRGLHSLFRRNLIKQGN